MNSVSFISLHSIAWECMTLQKPRTSWNVLEWWRSARCLVSKPFRTHSATCFSPISFSLLKSVVLTLSLPLFPRDAEISLYCLGDKLVLPCFSLALPRWLGSFGRGAFCRFQSLAGQLWCIWSIKRRLPKRKGKVYKWKTTMCVSFATCKCYFLGLCSFNLCILLHHSPLQLTFHVCFHLFRTCNAWRNALTRCLSPWSNVNRTCCTATVTSGRGQHSPNIQIDEKAKQLRLINWSRHIKTANFGNCWVELEKNRCEIKWHAIDAFVQGHRLVSNTSRLSARGQSGCKNEKIWVEAGVVWFWRVFPFKNWKITTHQRIVQQSCELQFFYSASFSFV